MITNFVSFWFFSLIIASYAATEFEIKKIHKEINLHVRVNNGNLSEVGEWPWLATLHKVKDREYFCGSSIISEKLLVTGEKKLKK